MTAPVLMAIAPQLYNGAMFARYTRLLLPDKIHSMRTIALEEHITLPEMVALLPPQKNASQPASIQHLAGKLADIGSERIASMDRNGISLQVLSVVGAGGGLLDAAAAPAFCRQYNDVVAEKIAPYPGRLAAFAHLPMQNPEAAAAELERTVQHHAFKGALINGLTNGAFLDNPRFAPVLEKAVELDVPLYLHPAPPPKAVADAYYSGLPKAAGNLLSLAGWGWHSETAIHVLRLIISGTFDKYPALKLIIGHMGEMLPVMMARCDNVFGTPEAGIHQRSISETLRSQVYITTSGIFTQPPLKAALDTFGIDHILFSVDYPFSTNETGRKFLDELQLDETDMQKLTHGNALKLFKTFPGFTT